MARLNTLWREGEQPLRAGRRERGKARNRPAAPQPTESMDLDRLIHEKMRLGIVSALAVNDSLSFNDLKKLLDASDGNLSVHARRLEEADYINSTKSSNGTVSITTVALTGHGRAALGTYTQALRNLLDGL